MAVRYIRRRAMLRRVTVRLLTEAGELLVTEAGEPLAQA